MTRRAALVQILLYASVLPIMGCDRSAALKGQSNSVLTFYGLAVDENEAPLAGVQLVIEVEAIPPGWSFETRGKPHVFSTVNATSGADGRLEARITGHILRIKEARRPGYRHLYDIDQGSGKPGENMFFRLDAWSAPWYKSDHEHPAVFVFVKDGVQEVSALPCKGGWDSGGGKQWRLNQPGWPRKPSLPDVVQKRPTTKP